MITQCFFSELLSPEELIRIRRDTGCGLELIQFSVSENLDHFSDTMKKEKELLARMDHPPVTIHGPFLDLNPMTFDSRIRQVVLDRFAQAYEAAEELHAARIIFHSGMVPTVYFLEGWAERMTAFWEDFLPGRREIPVCMENVLDREYEPFAEIAAALTDRFPNFGICLDLGHAHCYSSHPETDWTSALKPYILHLHLHDNDGTADSHHALGTGTVQWETVLDAVRTQPQDITMTVECNTCQDAQTSLQAIQKQLREVKRDGSL